MSRAPTEQRSPSCILVTGGAGFIGSAFIRHVLGQAGFSGKIVNYDSLTYAGNLENVAAVAHDSRYVFVQGDICDEALVGRTCDDHHVDTIVNLAAETHVDRSIVGPGAFIETNVVGTFHLLEVNRARPHVHLHHVSTDEVYGSLPATGHFRENSPYAPNSPYAASKAASDHLVRAYAHTFGLSTTLSHCSNNYGPCQFPEKLVPLMIANMLESKSLPVYGDGSNVRDWVHVADHANALWTIVRCGKRGETYDVGGQTEQTNLELLRRLILAVSEQARMPADQLEALITFVPDRPGHDLRYAIDCTKLMNELGWRCEYELSRGLSETVRWYLDNPGWVSRVKSGAYREWIETNYALRGTR